MYLQVVTLLSAVQLSVSVTKIHMVYWNSSNPIFRIDNTRHIVDVNFGNQLNIICPVAGHGRGTRGREEGER